MKEKAQLDDNLKDLTYMELLAGAAVSKGHRSNKSMAANIPKVNMSKIISPTYEQRKPTIKF